MEIKKEKDLLGQQSASQQETALLKITQLLLCLILSAWQQAGPSFPLGEAECCQLTGVCRGICYLRCGALWLMGSHHHHLESGFAAGTEHFTPAQCNGFGGQGTP